MLLTINGINRGKVASYKQDRTEKQWIFTMLEGFSIVLDFERIKLFNSSGDLEIIYKTN